MVSNSSTLIAGVLVAGYVVMILVVFGRGRAQRDTNIRWLILALFAAGLGIASTLLPADAHIDPAYQDLFPEHLTQPALGIIAANLMLVMFGSHLLNILKVRSARIFTVFGLVWWIAATALSVMAENPTLGTHGWYRRIYDPIEWPNALTFGGWLVMGVLLIVAAMYAFYRARLPEIANRALFAELLILPIFIGVGLGASDEQFLTEAGWIIQCAGLLGVVYNVSVYRVLDLRRTFRQATWTIALTLIMALVIYLALVLAEEIEPDNNNIYAILAGIALGVAILYMSFRAVVQSMIDRIVDISPARVSQKLRRFSEDITGAVELDQVVDVTLHTLSEVLRVRRGGLVLLSMNADNGKLLMEPLKHGLGEMPDIRGYLDEESPVYNCLVADRAPLLQYDLDYAHEYAGTPGQERQFFEAMHMSAYAPIVVQNHLIGILCSGPKSTDVPFTEADLELMRTIASQTGVALRNARLVTDLRRREAEQAQLNVAISETKEQLERLDGVKTDFITIASHELRTPLAQIRGYTDIMEAINQEEMLDQEQIAGMTANMRKAADRLEELIGAMLDVSQIDVNAMDLRFAQVSVESCMRQAIEPLTDAIKNRRLMLAARGLRELPPIQGDMQRLVQAFRNVVLNAIKYTPDGGRIDIRGQMQDDELIIMIKDSGIGIAPENHTLIFEKFFRAHDPSLHSTGTTKFMGAGPGLGLTIARGVITAHGGRIWVESVAYDPEIMPGSTFFIALPLEPPETAARVSPFEPTVSLTGGSSHEAMVELSHNANVVGDSSPTIPKPPANLRGG